MGLTMTTLNTVSPRYRVIHLAGAIRANCPTINGAAIEALAFEFAKAPTAEAYRALIDAMAAHASAIPLDVRRALLMAGCEAREASQCHH